MFLLLLFFPPPPLVPPSLVPPGHQPDRPGELGDGAPLGERLLVGEASGEGGHVAPPALPLPLAAAQHRHGREDEEDGGAAAVRHQGDEEQEGRGEPGQLLPGGDGFNSFIYL